MEPTLTVSNLGRTWTIESDEFEVKVSQSIEWHVPVKWDAPVVITDPTVADAGPLLSAKVFGEFGSALTKAQDIWTDWNQATGQEIAEYAKR